MDINSKNIALHVDDDNVALFDRSKDKTGAGLIAWFKRHKVQFGGSDATVDVDLDVVGPNGSIKYDAGEGFLRLTTLPLILSGLSFPLTTVTAKTSAAGYTLTAAEVVGGYVIDATNTGAIAPVMPTVAAVVALIPGWVAGTSFLFTYVNTGNQTVTLTTDASTQWTMTGTMTALTTTTRIYLCRILTAATGVVYGIGTFAN
uniref:Uncharacterized protein n=1 Tax=viral metagenome TaxID=1070528 RepID=A0A6H1ZQ24_9ZZZZ